MLRKKLTDFDAAYGLKFVCFRYFNAAGADPDRQLGEAHKPETHLIPLVLQAALGQRESISIFGTDYPTLDGSCIRDYIHVTDLAQAHLLGLEYLLKGNQSEVFNLGNGKGFSVKQVIDIACLVTGKQIKVTETERRPGDPPILVASYEKATEILGWTPQFSDLKDIIVHAWEWHQKCHGQSLYPVVETRYLSRSACKQPAPVGAGKLKIDNPLVSVIIPAYNAEKFIERTLRSVLDQTYRHLEVIVVDNGSSDRTVEIVKHIAQKDSRLNLLTQKVRGVAKTRNYGIQHAKGKFIAPVDADDIWYPENIEKQLSVLQQAPPEVGLTYAWSLDINENDQPIGEFRASKIQGDVYKTLICHNFVGNASASLIRKECFDRVGGYNSDFNQKNAQGCEDWDLQLRIAEYYQFRVTPEFLIGYRKTTSSMSTDFTKMADSHSLLLDDARKQTHKFPFFLYRLSRSSLYIYFARQSSQYAKYRDTLHWLFQAIKMEPITPLFRYGFYVLAFKGLMGMLGFAELPNAELTKARDSISPQISKRSIQEENITVGCIPSQIRIQFKLLVGNLLHLSLKYL